MLLYNRVIWAGRGRRKGNLFLPFLLPAHKKASKMLGLLKTAQVLGFTEYLFLLLFKPYSTYNR